MLFVFYLRNGCLNQQKDSERKLYFFFSQHLKCVNFPHQAILTLLPGVSADPTGYGFSPTRLLPTSDTSRKSGPQVLLSEHL